eukprot:3851182-Pleurochrysis_carterae.AAC.2
MRGAGGVQSGKAGPPTFRESVEHQRGRLGAAEAAHRGHGVGRAEKQIFKRIARDKDPLAKVRLCAVAQGCELLTFVHVVIVPKRQPNSAA